MIGLSFLAVGLFWTAFSWCLAKRVPGWLSIRHPSAQWLMRAGVMLVLLVGPFVDHVIGMAQFERLCKERAVVWVSSGAEKVTAAKEAAVKHEDLFGYWISIHSRKITFLDASTGIQFMGYETLSTKGGRIARIALMGGEHSCRPSNPNQLNYLNIDNLLKQGENK